jgi:hypothetical protein
MQISLPHPPIRVNQDGVDQHQGQRQAESFHLLPLLRQAGHKQIDACRHDAAKDEQRGRDELPIPFLGEQDPNDRGEGDRNSEPEQFDQVGEALGDICHGSQSYVGKQGDNEDEVIHFVPVDTLAAKEPDREANRQRGNEEQHRQTGEGRHDFPQIDWLFDQQATGENCRQYRKGDDSLFGKHSPICRWKSHLSRSAEKPVEFWTLIAARPKKCRPITATEPIPAART